ncbi:MAG: hypothetical protein WDN31_20645 [Hyphomicrobium sp.]
MAFDSFQNSSGVDADLRQEGVVLHGARRECAVEVVDEGDGLLVEACLVALARLRLYDNVGHVFIVRNALSHRQAPRHIAPRGSTPRRPRGFASTLVCATVE